MSAHLPEIWLLDDDPALRRLTGEALRDAGHATREFADVTELHKALARQLPALLITDIRLPGSDGLDLLAQLHQAHPQLPVVIVTAHSDLQSAVAAYQGGAFEYLPKPFDLDELLSVVARALQQSGPQNAPATAEPDGDHVLIGDSPAMQIVYRSIARLAGTHFTVLISGESGTGKELAARALHRHSPRARQPFVALNTAAIPAELLESELFGHERGAFTGASARHAGRFEQAHGGTLFLDEIGDMPSALQTRLLRVLAEGEFYRVGGHEALRADVRVLAATHQDLDALIRQGRFREDLFHRLNVMRIHMPALRERFEDIPLLLQHFVNSASRELGTAPKRFTAEAMRALQQRAWPGNVRELANACRRLMLMTAGRIIHQSDLDALAVARLDDAPAADQWPQQLHAWVQRELLSGTTAIAERARAELSRILIETALEHTGGRRQQAARRLGMGRNTLARKLKRS
ncbi:MAG TPA: nitrogen regulation protein NR(I) [Gammaproteobacteria bacterium]|nr:nitrogen regulation protein NR(I) [Gammaproteobacteria bacterium]